MIDYKIIHESNVYYEEKGFSRIEAPWTVSKPISDITKPESKQDFKIEYNQKVLVASGEQSFLYLYLKQFLPKGKFQTTTPCFRDEIFDSTHTKYFIKTELIDTKIVTTKSLDEMVNKSLTFFSKYLSKETLSIDKSEEGFDINYNFLDKKYELGSYGIRECDFLSWVYGTGCAEPRLSSIINLKRHGISLKRNTKR
jgi:hypothetical protein